MRQRLVGVFGMLPRLWRAPLAVLLVTVVAASLLSLGSSLCSSAAADSEAGRDSEGPQTSRGTARSSFPAADEDQLSVEINSITPAVMPTKGPITVTGTVTNLSADTWNEVNLYLFTSQGPIQSAGELGQAALTDPADEVGTRITVPDNFDTVETLPAGATSSYTITVSQDVLKAHILGGSPGVYWLGVHALGESVEVGRDMLADGRARTFAPFVGPEGSRVSASMVVPVRREVLYARDGSLRGVRRWARDLEPGGRLHNLLEFGQSAPSGSLTWLIDPAVLAAVQQLAEGNQPRNLGAPSGTEPPPDEDGETPTKSAATDVEGGGESASTPSVDSSSAAVTARKWASDWLGDIARQADRQTVLGLPYGDVDMAAATDLDPQLSTRARTLSAEVFKSLGIAAMPAVAPPSGFLTRTMVAAQPEDVTILGSTAVLPAGAADPAHDPIEITVAGHIVDLYDETASTGGPGPTDPYSALAVRQRFLSEAYLRSRVQSQQPLLMAMPDDWDPGAADSGFFPAFNRSWLDLVPETVLGAPSRPRIPATRLVYPARQDNRELDLRNFDAADDLVRAGALLQSVLVETPTIERSVAAQALTTTSYSVRTDPERAARVAERARRSIRSELNKVSIDTVPYVTLSSGTGRFRVDLTNDLEQQVTLGIRAITDEGLEISAPAKNVVPGKGTTSVFVHVTSDELGTHDVRLLVTNTDGTPLGSHTDVPIRTTQSGRIIWVIIGVGAVLLFGAILRRLWRRILGRGSTDPTDGPTEDETGSPVGKPAPPPTATHEDSPA